MSKMLQLPPIFGQYLHTAILPDLYAGELATGGSWSSSSSRSLMCQLLDASVFVFATLGSTK
jgi:hypothetical protein